MIEVKQAGIKKIKCHTININDLDPFRTIYILNYIQENLNSSNPLRIKINSARKE